MSCSLLPFKIFRLSTQLSVYLNFPTYSKRIALNCCWLNKKEFGFGYAVVVYNYSSTKNLEKGKEKTE